MSARLKKYFHPRLFWFFLALAVLFALVLHITVFDHHHPDRLFGSEEQAAHHGEERRWWAALLAMAFITKHATLFQPFLEKRTHKRSYFLVLYRVCETVANFAKIFDPVRRALSSGIVHSRLFAEGSHDMSFAE
ncbi:MAG: hypothetical protein Q8Q94_02645 [bacterium]|nr:hypothetical protein [bacterium]MDZ4299664.1 hypothetical protein [Candidatus Sungbacteria bacterium]